MSSTDRKSQPIRQAKQNTVKNMSFSLFMYLRQKKGYNDNYILYVNGKEIFL